MHRRLSGAKVSATTKLTLRRLQLEVAFYATYFFVVIETEKSL